MNMSLIKKSCPQKSKSNLSYIPLSMIQPKTQVVVKSISVKNYIRKFLADLGFVPNAMINVISKFSGNIIVSVKGTRVGIDKSIASKIMTSIA